MPIDPIKKAAVDEAMRRRANLGASSAAIGAESANSLSPENPVAQAGSTNLMTNPPQMAGGADGSPVGGATQQLKQEKSESRLILETIAKRLKVLSERGQ